MPFCMNCGQQLPDGAKFCAECGTPTQAFAQSQRKNVYDGEIHKCPNCGESLEAFSVKCLSCGYELRDASVTTAIKAFNDKLELATTIPQKMQIIQNFPVPNTKEDIFEFMLLAFSNFDATYHAAHQAEEDISDAWLAKIEQCYQKAKISFGDDPDFGEVLIRYEEAHKKRENSIADYNKMQKEEREYNRKIEIKVQLAEEAEKFKKGKAMKFLIAIAIIVMLMGTIAFATKNVLSGVFSVLMLCVVVSALLVGLNMISVPSLGVRLLTILLAFLLCLPFSVLYFGNLGNEDAPDEKKEVEKEVFEWPADGVSQYLPNPPTNYGQIHTDNESRFNIDFYQISKTNFENYVKSCKEKGFTIGVTKTDSVFYAYNSDEYELNIFYYEDDDKLSVYLDAPLKMANIKWPQNDLVNRIPVPDSQIGNIRWENSELFGVYIANMDANKYSDYVDKCIQKGFNIDYSRGETTFRAYDAEGYLLVVEKHLFDKIYISVEIPEK